MNQYFLNLTLKSSDQQVSCITLENWIDQLNNPDFRENLKQSNDQIEMIKLFPIVGYGLQITYKQQDGMKVKVKSISQVEKIIDWTTIQQDKQHLTRDKPNCILPLLNKKEKNEELLNCEIFKRKISYLITKNHQIYNENSYIILIQSTLKHLIKVNNNSQWQQEMLKEIYEVCQQVFIGTKIYQDNIRNQEFKSSQFQLLNVFCLFLQKQIGSEDIYNNFIIPLLQNIRSFQLNDEGQNGLGKYFDSLIFKKDQINFEDINICIFRYLEENDYFYSRLFYGKYLSNLISFFIPNDKAKEKLRQEIFFQQKEQLEENNKYQQQRQIIINFTQSAIYKYLFNTLIDEYKEENKIKYFESLNQSIEKGNYYSFLQNYSKYEDLVQYYNLNTLLSNEHTYENGVVLFIQYIVQQLLKQISIFELRKTSFTNWQYIKQSQSIIEKQKKIKQFIKIFGIHEQQAELVENEILDTISEICWLNCQALEINFQRENDIINFLTMIKDFPQGNNLKKHFNLHQKYLNDLTQFCFKIKSQTQIYKYFGNFEANELNQTLPKDPRRAQNFLKIYQVSRNLIRI